MAEPSCSRPPYVTGLESVYGSARDAGFGSAVFFDGAQPGAGLEDRARGHYRGFLGGLWEKRGAETWLKPWRVAYRRPSGGPRDLVAELRATGHLPTQLQVDLLVDSVADPARARQALAGAFDAPDVAEVVAFHIGDGEVLEGLLVAGRRTNGEAVFLVSLYD